MKKISGFSLAILLASGGPLLANPIEDFKNQTQTKVLEPFAKDFGGLIGASDFHGAKVPKLGGFDVGVYAGIQFKPDDENLVLKNAGVDAFGLPMLRAEIGLPAGFSVFGRGVSSYGASLFGGGLRYHVLKPEVLNPMPHVALTAGYDKFSHDILDMTHFGVSVQASYELPILKPFAGIGFDSTKIEVAAASNPLLTSLEATGSGVRLTAGANLTLIPFTYLYGAYSIINGNGTAQFGLGARFGGIL